MMNKILEKKKILVIVISVLLVIGAIVAVSLTMNNDEDKEVEVVDRYADMTDAEIIAEAFDNMEALKSFQTDGFMERISKNTEFVPNFTTDSVILQDLDNMLIHAVFEEILNGEEKDREYYHKAEGDTYMYFDYNEGEWTYSDTEFDGTFFTFDFMRDIIDTHEYTTVKEVDKLTVNIEYTYDDLKDTENAQYLDEELVGTYKFVFEDGYFIEYYSTKEDSSVSEKVDIKYSRFNEEMNIIIPDDVLSLKE